MTLQSVLLVLLENTVKRVQQLLRLAQLMLTALSTQPSTLTVLLDNMLVMMEDSPCLVVIPVLQTACAQEEMIQSIAQLDSQLLMVRQ